MSAICVEFSLDEIQLSHGEFRLQKIIIKTEHGSFYFTERKTALEFIDAVFYSEMKKGGAA